LVPVTSALLESIDPTKYLGALPLDARRRAGQVYTPLHLVQFVLAQAGYLDAALEARPLFDPACGAGVFLVAAVDAMANALARSGVELTSRSGRNRLTGQIESSLFGADTDAVAIRFSQLAISSAVGRWTGVTPASGFSNSNLVLGDFLLDPTVRNLPPVRDGGFFFVVGNPPYVSAVRLRQEYKDQLRARFISGTGRLDLYTVFMEHAVALLRPRGRFAFITPDKYLTSQTSAPLRRLLEQEGSLVSVARFRSHRVFTGAATVPCVTVFERSRRPTRTAVLDCDDLPQAGSVRVLRRSHARTSMFPHGEWRFDARDLGRLEASIQAAHPPLSAFVSRHSAGTASGRDAVFVLPKAAAATLDPELMRPALRGRDVLPFELNNPGLALLVPYSFDDAGRPKLIDLRRYSKASAYLRAHEEVLRNRHCVRVWEKAWFDLHDPMPIDIGRLPKILVPDVASHNRFAFDPGDYWPLHSSYYLVPKQIDPIYLTALLNSTPIEFLIRLRAPVVKDGFSRYRKQFLGPLPIPQVSARQRAQVVRAVEGGDYSRANELATELFGLSPAERRRIDDYLMEISGPTRG
jgi:adenine-specific DNA-methyltransferase